MYKIALLFLLILFSNDILSQKYEEINIGDKAPMLNVQMKDISGKNYSLNDLSQTNGLVIIFSCNTCPFVIAWEDRYASLAKLASAHKMGFVLVNSNAAKRDNADSFEKMKQHASDAGYGGLKYVLDKDSKLANAFGAKTTPHVFVLNGALKLAYKGAIDNNFKDKDNVSETYLQDAIEQIGHGYSVDVDVTPSKGCSIKRIN